ncbi:MAG: hypothetical protein OIN85_01015 [Candidatus Methanoperedens sp.]|nr:hypothetical protein [Candidatus Methanoperedens sp.]
MYKRLTEEVKVVRRNWDNPYTVKLPNKTDLVIPRIYGNNRFSTYPAESLGRITLSQRIVGFCGNFYPVVTVTVDSCDNPTGKIKPLYFYDADSFSEFAAKENIFRQEARYWYSPRWDSHNLKYEQGVKNFFAAASELKKCEEIFHAFKVPTFVLGDDEKLILNPCLKSFGFMKVKDPQTAFQDVYMFLSGVIGAPPPPKEKMSDKVLAAAKGHDGEYSFKKPPGKRGKTRWR